MKRPRAVAWLHTLHMEAGQTFTRVTIARAEPWNGEHSPEYVVTSEALVRRDPRVRKPKIVV